MSRATPDNTDMRPVSHKVHYMVFGLLAGAGVALTVAALLIAAAPPATMVEPPPDPPPTAAAANPPQFPTQFDRLGVVVGRAEAPVTVREFGDYQCPACRPTRSYKP